MSFFNDLFLSFDFMSESLSFENNGDKNFKCCFGSFISILVIIATIIISSIFGKELIERKLPLMSGYNNYISESKFNLLDFPLFFMVSQTRGRILENPFDYFTIYGEIVNRTNSVPDYSNRYEYISKKCEKSDLVNLTKYIKEEEINEVLKLPIVCFNFTKDSVIKNDYAFSNSSYVNLNFEYCNPSKRICPSDVVQKQNDFFIRTYFINNYINSMDYENPVTYILDSHLQQVGKGFLRRNYIRFTKDIFISDNGWLLEDKSEIEFVSFKSISIETNSIPLNYPDSYYWITVASPQVRNITFRSYLKVQELAAKIGGIINAITICAYVLFSNYLRFIYIFNVSEHIIEGEISYNQFNKESKKALINMSKNKLCFTENKLNQNNNESNQNRMESENIEENEISKTRKYLNKSIDREKSSYFNLNKESMPSPINKKLKNKGNINDKLEKIEYQNENEINLRKKLEFPKLNKINDKFEQKENLKNEIEKLNELDKLNQFIHDFSYWEYIIEYFKICSCCSKDKNLISLKFYLSKNLDFFSNIKKLTMSTIITKE